MFAADVALVMPPGPGRYSPLLSNIDLHAFDRAMTGRGIGELVRHADDFVVLCRSEREANAALQSIGEILAGLGLELHPDKTKVVDLREGREGFDFLGWHFRARVSGRLLERGIRRYYLHLVALAALDEAPTSQGQGQDRPQPGRNQGCPRADRGAQPDPTRLGRIRTGNAADKFRQIDRYAAWRLKRLLIKRKGRTLRAGEAAAWTEDWLVSLGLYRLRGTIRYPGAA